MYKTLLEDDIWLTFSLSSVKHRVIILEKIQTKLLHFNNLIIREFPRLDIQVLYNINSSRQPRVYINYKSEYSFDW